MPHTAEPLPLLLWESFDDEEMGERCLCPHPARWILKTAPACLEAAFYSADTHACFGILLQEGTDGERLRLCVDVAASEARLERSRVDQSETLASTALQLPQGTDDLHLFMRIALRQDVFICSFLDLQQDWRVPIKPPSITNIGIFASTGEQTRCRLLRAWSQIPDWNGRDQVEPMWGAQHIWTKFQQRHVGNHDRSYWGWVTIWGAVQLRCYDHGQKCFGPIETVYHYPGRLRWPYDDHHPPGIYVHNDGHVWVWIQSHKSQDPFLLLRSRNPEDISSWREPIDMNTQQDAPPGGVYPRAYCASNNDVLLFHRCGGSNDGEWYLRRSSDGGQNWDAQKIIDNSEGHVYQFIRQDPRDPDHLVLIGNHKDTSIRPFSWRRIYTWETRDAGQTFQTVTDQQRLSLPVKRSDLEVVHDGASHQLFVMDQAIDADGTSVIIAAHCDEPDHEYLAFRWRADSWQQTRICSNRSWPPNARYNQQVWRPAGGSINPHDTSEICIAVAEDSMHEIQSWRMNEEGDWHKTADITSDSCVSNFRPVYIENAHPDDWQLLWHSGNFYGTTPAPHKGRHFDRFDDVQIINELLQPMIKRRSTE